MINIGLAIKGRYRLQTKKNGKVTKDSGWFDNLITNNGMNLIAINTNWHRYCSVGSSSATPAFTDIALGSRIATTDTPGTPSSSIQPSERYFIGQKIHTFVAGTATGNVSEIGIGSQPDGTSLFSRALVLDTMGNPTSITVLPDEDLVVVYQLWIKQPIEDYNLTVGGRNIVMRACRVNDTDPIATQRNLRWSFNSTAVFQLPSGAGNIILFSGDISAITGYPSGTQQTGGGTPVMAAYVTDSHEITGTITFPTGSGNSAAIKSFGWVFGPTCWQAQLDTEITKTNLQTLRFGLKLSWSRDSGPA